MRGTACNPAYRFRPKAELRTPGGWGILNGEELHANDGLGFAWTRLRMRDRARDLIDAPRSPRTRRRMAGLAHHRTELHADDPGYPAGRNLRADGRSDACDGNHRGKG